MPSKAHAKFNKTHRRCIRLVNSYIWLRKAKKRDKNIPAPGDIIRGAVVLGVAALDSYVTDVFCEKLVPYLKRYRPSPQLIKLLEEAGLDTREALNLITMERPYRRIRTLIEHHYDSYTTQRFDVIDKMFLPYGLKDITKHAEKKSYRRTLRVSVQKLVSSSTVAK